MSAPTDDSISAFHFRQILDISRMLAVTTELDILLTRIAKAATTLLNCERASIFVHDDKTGELCSTVALQSGEIRVPGTSGIVGHAFTSNALVHVVQPYEDARFNPEPDRRSGFITRNLLAAPMVDLSRRPLGVIQAVNNQSADGFGTFHESMIQLLADQAGVALQRFRLQQRAVEATYLRREMELAGVVQQALIPRTPPTVSGLETLGWTKPASITGGDTFDLWRTSDGRLGIFVADASGHGLGPAMVVSQTRSMVRAMSDVNPDPHHVLDRVNARLAQDLPGGSFVTAFVGFVSSDGTVEWSAAGHGPMLFRRSHGAPFEELTPPAPPLGVDHSFNGAPTEPVQLEAGGLLVVASDGVLEARNPERTIYGTNRLAAALDRSRDEPLDKQLASIRGDLVAWQGREEPADDQTIVLLRKT